MKSNTAAKPQTIWWSDSAYIIFRILRRGLFVLLVPFLKNTELDIKSKKTERGESGKVICDIFFLFFSVVFYFVFLYFVFFSTHVCPSYIAQRWHLSPPGSAPRPVCAPIDAQIIT